MALVESRRAQVAGEPHKSARATCPPAASITVLRPCPGRNVFCPGQLSVAPGQRVRFALSRDAPADATIELGALPGVPFAGSVPSRVQLPRRGFSDVVIPATAPRGAVLSAVMADDASHGQLVLAVLLSSAANSPEAAPAIATSHSPAGRRAGSPSASVFTPQRSPGSTSGSDSSDDDDGTVLSARTRAKLKLASAQAVAGVSPLAARTRAELKRASAAAAVTRTAPPAGPRARPQQLLQRALRVGEGGGRHCLYQLMAAMGPSLESDDSSEDSDGSAGGEPGAGREASLASSLRAVVPPSVLMGPSPPPGRTVPPPPPVLASGSRSARRRQRVSAAAMPRADVALPWTGPVMGRQSGARASAREELERRRRAAVLRLRAASLRAEPEGGAKLSSAVREGTGTRLGAAEEAAAEAEDDEEDEDLEGARRALEAALDAEAATSPAPVRRRRRRARRRRAAAEPTANDGGGSHPAAGGATGGAACAVSAGVPPAAAAAAPTPSHGPGSKAAAETGHAAVAHAALPPGSARNAHVQDGGVAPEADPAEREQDDETQAHEAPGEEAEPAEAAARAEEEEPDDETPDVGETGEEAATAEEEGAAEKAAPADEVSSPREEAATDGGRGSGRGSGPSLAQLDAGAGGSAAPGAASDTADPSAACRAAGRAAACSGTLGAFNASEAWAWVGREEPVCGRVVLVMVA